MSGLQEIKCPMCGRPSRGERATCMYCGSDLPVEAAPPAPPIAAAAAPPASVIKGADLPCPRCVGQSMAEGDLQGLTIFRCQKCMGIFLEGATFDYLIERQAEIAIQRGPQVQATRVGMVEPKVTYIACPVCKRQMARTNYARRSGVIIDECMAHGVWLDDQELQQVLGFLARSPGDIVRMLATEAKRRLARFAP